MGGVTTTTFSDDETGGLGEMAIGHPPGTFAPTPATRISLLTTGRHRRLLAGEGADWGTGVGVLAVAAARIAGVRHVTGVDIDRHNVIAARANATAAGVADRTEFLVSDSFATLPTGMRLDFLLANPPASEGDDGLGYRRRVLSGALDHLRPGAEVIMAISSQYGAGRIAMLEKDIPAYRHGGVLETTKPVPFDLGRSELRTILDTYVGHERGGGRPYEFADEAGRPLDARTALSRHERTGASPLMRWQTHRFTCMVAHTS